MTSKATKARRDGKEAFHIAANRHESCPYNGNHPYWQDWMDGWENARKEYERGLEEKLEEDDEWIMLMCECPSQGDYAECGISNKFKLCKKENCTPWHFRNF